MRADEYADSKRPRDGWCAEALAAVRELGDEVQALKQASAEPLTDSLAQFLAAQYVLAARDAVREANGERMDLKLLRALCADALALRRGDHTAARLRLDHERFEEEARKRRAVEEAAKQEANRPKAITSETINRIQEAAKLL